MYTCGGEMSIEIDHLCDHPECGKRIRKDESCYCHDCYTEWEEEKERLEKEVQELEQRLAMMDPVQP